MATPHFFGPENLFNAEATGQVVGFLRKASKYKLMEYCQLVKSTRTGGDGKPVCLFVTLDPDAPVRVVTDQEYAWPDNSDAPEGAGALTNFTTTEVRMFRRAYPYRLSEQVVDTAQFLKPMPIEREIALNKAMVNKTQRIWSLLDTSSNWGANTADCSVINGGRGKWSTASSTEGSPYYLAIKRSITAAVKAVNLATNGMVQCEDLKMVISPDLAEAGANSGEITDYLKGSVHAKAVQDGKERFKNSQYGFPDAYAGVEICVEDGVRVSERPNAAGTAATANRAYIKDGTKACLVSRKGGLDGVEGSPTFSTVQIYYYKYEMAVEQRYDAWQKRHDGRILEQYKEVLASSRSGYLITGCR